MIISLFPHIPLKALSPIHIVIRGSQAITVTLVSETVQRLDRRAFSCISSRLLLQQEAHGPHHSHEKPVQINSLLFENPMILIYKTLSPLGKGCGPYFEQT